MPESILDHVQNWNKQIVHRLKTDDKHWVLNSTSLKKGIFDRFWAVILGSDLLYQNGFKCGQLILNALTNAVILTPKLRWSQLKILEVCSDGWRGSYLYNLQGHIHVQSSWKCTMYSPIETCRIMILKQ